MKISQNWLSKWVEINVSTQELGDTLTMAGLELDAIEHVNAEFDGVVVAEIVDASRHPDADKLQVCTVSIGTERFSVVCGASNARVGIRVAFAQVGATLPSGMAIKQAKLRGVDSFGMLCSAAELGLADKSEGILELDHDAPLGKSVDDYLELDDSILDIDLTPNRADCLSVHGIAREYAALSSSPVVNAISQHAASDQWEQTYQSDASNVIKVSATNACPRYIAIAINNIDVSVKTPDFIIENLRRSGLRSIDPVVDITNYVMLELGQPMHAFDADKLNGSIDVRLATADEPLTLLDGKAISLDDKTLVIADESGPLAIAGVMGGASTGINNESKNILLESAFFTLETVAGTARRYGLHTDSSHRFERGVDFELQKVAAIRATQLILDICGGDVVASYELVSADHLPKVKPIKFAYDLVERRLGVKIQQSRVESILTNLGCALSPFNEGWDVAPPSFRFDLRIAEDLTEEIARVYGYNNIPATTYSSAMTVVSQNEATHSIEVVQDALVAEGYQEVITYSFIDEAIAKQLSPGESTIALANPISKDLAVMRNTLWAGLIKSALHNLRRQVSRVKFHEVGQVFKAGDADVLQQRVSFAGLWVGNRQSEQWSQPNVETDFYDIKGDLESVFARLGLADAITYEVNVNPALHPGQSAEVFYKGESVGWIGRLHPKLEKTLSFNKKVFLFEVDYEKISKRDLPSFTELSKYPMVRRDLAFTIDKSVSYDEIKNSINSLQAETVKKVQIFDVYTGKNLPSDVKSIAVSLILQDFSRTLEDEQIDKLVNSVVSKLATELGATLRE